MLQEGRNLLFKKIRRRCGDCVLAGIDAEFLERSV